MTITATSDTATVATWVQAQGFSGEVVGSWVWVTFPGKPSTEIRESLKTAGFHWNRKRACWQHRCGGRRFTRAGVNPRGKYGAATIGGQDPWVRSQEEAMDRAYAGERAS